MRQITGLSRLLAQITHQVAALQHGLHLCAELSKALQIPVQNRSLSGNRRVLFLLSPMHADDPLQGGQRKSCQILHPGGRVCDGLQILIQKITVKPASQMHSKGKLIL